MGVLMLDLMPGYSFQTAHYAPSPREISAYQAIYDLEERAALQSK